MAHVNERYLDPNIDEWPDLNDQPANPRLRVVDRTARTAPALGQLPTTEEADLASRYEAERQGLIRSIRLPWLTLNRVLGNGLRPGEVTLLAGDPGVSKSYMALNILLSMDNANRKWRLQPLEDDPAAWAERMLAVRVNNWRMTSQPETDDPLERDELFRWKESVLQENMRLKERLDFQIARNPWIPRSDQDSASVTHLDVLDLIDFEAGDSELVCIDPLSQIEFSQDGRDYSGQADFMRRLVSKAKATGIHVLLVAHLKKRSVRDNAPPVLDDIQGSALFGRVAQNAVALVRHDPAIESELFSIGVPFIEHRLTAHVLKSRSGQSGQRIAFDLSRNGPTFIEHGLIKPKIRRK